MKFLLFIFLITRTQQYYFDQFIQNETYMDENRLQELNKLSDRTSGRSMISNKILVIIIACLSIVVIATLLTVYFTKDQMKDFASRMGIGQRGPVIHQFHPEVLLPSAVHKQQTSSYEQAHNKTKSKPIMGGGQKRERTSIHTFMNSSNKQQQDTISDYRQSQSAVDLFLYH